MRDFQLPGRSPVHSLHGMAASSHPLATLTALDVLRTGGNAMDAAVAACAVQCVVEPQSTGIGGDCFALYAPRGSADIVAYNGSGRAPAAADGGWYAERGIRAIDRCSPHAVTVPGAVDAWARLIADHGSRELGELLQPAIRHARDGYPVYSRTADDWACERAVLARKANTRALFMPDGRVPGVGEVHRQPLLAATLQAVAERGRDAFYFGAVAEDIVSHLQSLGGLHTFEDFATASGEYVTPIATDYRGARVYECPPNGQGLAALLMLNVLDGLAVDPGAPGSAARFHLQMEAKRLAYAARDRWIADPAHGEVPVASLLSGVHAAQLRAAIDRSHAMDALPPSALPAHNDTVYLCVVDRDLNAVSFINSLFHPFGSGIMSPRTGVMLQSRGCGFVLDPAHPNCIGPRKRPLHTIIPGLLVQGERAVMPFGVMGGHYQAVGHVQLVTNLLDHGMDVQEAIDFPRLLAEQDGSFEYERGVPAATIAELARMGHRPREATRPIGGGQAIFIDWSRGVLTGGSDPRKDGCALGY